LANMVQGAAKRETGRKEREEDSLFQRRQRVLYCPADSPYGYTKEIINYVIPTSSDCPWSENIPAHAKRPERVKGRMVRRGLYRVDRVQVDQPAHGRKSVRRIYLPLPESTAHTRRAVHRQPNKQALFSSSRLRVHHQLPHLDSQVRVERLHRVADEDRRRHVQRKPFEGQCSWKGGRQWSGRSVRQANGRTVYALHVPAFGDGDVDDLRSRRIYIGD